MHYTVDQRRCKEIQASLEIANKRLAEVPGESERVQRESHEQKRQNLFLTREEWKREREAAEAAVNETKQRAVEAARQRGMAMAEAQLPPPITPQCTASCEQFGRERH